VLLGLVALLAVLTFGVTTASVEGSLGPHRTHYDVTTDGTVTVDLGPLGTLQIDSPLPLGLGARAVVQEIPAEVTQVDAATTLQALSGDLQGYVQFFSGPQATLQDAVRALVADALLRSAVAALVLAAAVLGGRVLLGPQRRAELRAWLAVRARAISGLVALVVVGVLVLTSSGIQRAEPPGSRASRVFDGTPLEGARVTGRLGGVIDTYGGYLVDAYRDNEKFYADADEAMVAAWERRSRTDASRPATRPPGDLVTVVVVSDLHCNVGMAPLVRSLVELSEASLVLDAGDSTIDGTSVEQYCVTTFARAVPEGVPIVTSPGNHDSRETSAMYARAGATVLDGSVVTVAGIRILGDHDPNATRVGVGTVQAGPESAEEEAERLERTACDDGNVDLLLIHTPTVGEPTLDAGCAPAQISGHLHKRYGPERIGDGVRYISSSTAGATLGQPTVGPLRGTAELTVLHFDRRTHRFVDYQIVRVHPDRTAEVDERLPWPALPDDSTTVVRPGGGPRPF